MSKFFRLFKPLEDDGKYEEQVNTYPRSTKAQIGHDCDYSMFLDIEMGIRVYREVPTAEDLERFHW